MDASKIHAIEAEMAKFESEIRGPGQPQPPPPMNIPPRPAMFNSGALRFVPHAVRNSYAPPPPHPGMFAPPPGMGMMMRGGPMMMPPMPRPLRPPMPSAQYPPPPPPDYEDDGRTQQHIPPPSNAPVIEGAPEKYQAPGAIAAAGTGIALPKPAFSRVEDLVDSDEEISKPGPSKPVKTKSQGAFAIDGQPVLKQPTKYVRVAGGQIWEDSNLLEWDVNDFRLFAGDLGNEVNDELLSKTFRNYPGFTKAKVVRDKRTNRSKGYGFVSFTDPEDMIKAMREMNG